MSILTTSYVCSFIILHFEQNKSIATLRMNVVSSVPQVLLINFPSLGSMTAGENFKFIFRESKINDAILFFDECEAIFESRELGGHSVNLLLTEIERCGYWRIIRLETFQYCYWTLINCEPLFFKFTHMCRHDGLIILATNRPYDLDEAMHRRIMVAIEFRQPDHLLRKTIWQTHLPEQMILADDVDLVSSTAITLVPLIQCQQFYDFLKA